MVCYSLASISRHNQKELIRKTMKPFKDNFSKQSDLYVKFRPLYPTGLYAWLASQTPDCGLAWDCGTGNGQAAVGLAGFFRQVIATDPSAAQIANCLKHPKVLYRVEKAESASSENHSVDLLTIANALHWFDFDVFYKEAARILKPGGIIAAWAYGLPFISKEIDTVIRNYHDQTLGNYWLPENRLVENRYQTIPFPFATIDAPEFEYEKPMRLDEIGGYLDTWSATQRFIDQNGYNPTEKVLRELSKTWDGEDAKTVTWKLILKIGKTPNR